MAVQSKAKVYVMTYVQQLMLNPVKTKSQSAFVFSLLQELFTELATGQKLNLSRVLLCGLAGGAVHAPLSHYVGERGRAVISHPLAMLAFVLFISLPISATANLLTTFSIYGRDLSMIPQVLPQVLRRLWVIYPFVIIGVQKKVPPVFQVLAFQFIGMVLGVISAVNAKKAAAKQAKAKRLRASLLKDLQ